MKDDTEVVYNLVSPLKREEDPEVETPSKRTSNRVLCEEGLVQLVVVWKIVLLIMIKCLK